MRACVYISPVHACGAHVVPAAYCSHLPAPSHAPSVSQLGAPLSAHWFSGSCPAGTGEHVPSLPGTAHDWHVPVHALPQQMPCSQNPDVQSVGAAQLPPRPFFPQLPFRHRLPFEHCAFVVHVPKQTPPVLHWKGTHVPGVGATHTPLPSQADLAVNAVPEHVLAAHTVPDAYLRQAPAPLHAPSLPQLVAPSSVHWFSGSWPF